MIEVEHISDLGIKHHFGGGVYIKETHIPKGYVLVQHKHHYDHQSILASGSAVMNGVTYVAPVVLKIEAGTHHGVKALTDCVWYCIHATKEDDPEKIDQ